MSGKKLLLNICPYLIKKYGRIPPITGKLASVCSGAGKRRLFAIGNYINQRLLAPVHEWLACVLRSLKMDGTFDQLAPLRRLSGIPGTAYSIDLTAATDRWPLLLLFELFQTLFDREFSSSVVNSTLGTNVFMVPARKPSNITFTAGQPLGYHASWPLFALSHHTLVWYAADLCYPGLKFDRYAILGDDVLIIDDAVAKVYTQLLDAMGVKVSEAKSIISPTGAVEFAKRFLVRNGTVDLSPFSFRKALTFYDPIAWYSFVKQSGNTLRASTYLRIHGIGFKSRSLPLSSPRKSRRVRRAAVMLLKACLPFNLWLITAFQKAIPFEVLGMVVALAVDRMKPLDPILPPSELFPYPGMNDFNEWSLYHGWMRQYLVYLKWYCQVALDPVVTLDQLFDAPIYTRTWFIAEDSNDTFSYGFMFHVYDIVERGLRSPPRVFNCQPVDPIDGLPEVICLGV